MRGYVNTFMLFLGLMLAVLAVIWSFRGGGVHLFQSLKTAGVSTDRTTAAGIRDNEAFAVARQADTPEAYAIYMEEFQDGWNAQEASIRQAFCRLKKRETRAAAIEELVNMDAPVKAFLFSALQNETPDAAQACRMIIALAEKQHPFVTPDLAGVVINSPYSFGSLKVRCRLFQQAGSGEEVYAAKKILELLEKDPDQDAVVLKMTASHQVGTQYHQPYLKVLGHRAFPAVLRTLQYSLTDPERSDTNDRLWQFLASHKWQPGTPAEEVIYCMARRDWEGLNQLADPLPAFLKPQTIISLWMVALKHEETFPPALRMLLDKTEKTAAERAFREIFNYYFERLSIGDGTRMERLMRLIRLSSAFGGQVGVEMLAEVFDLLEWKRPFIDDYEIAAQFRLYGTLMPQDRIDAEQLEMAKARQAILAAQATLTDGQDIGGCMEYLAWRQGIVGYKVPLPSWGKALQCPPRPIVNLDNHTVPQWLTVSVKTDEHIDYHARRKNILTTTTKKGFFGIILENMTPHHAAVLLKGRHSGICYAARLCPKQAPVFFAFPQVQRAEHSQLDEWHDEYYDVSYTLSDNPNTVIYGALKPLRGAESQPKYAQTAKARSPSNYNHPPAVWAVLPRDQMQNRSSGFIETLRYTTPPYAFTKPITLVFMNAY